MTAVLKSFLTCSSPCARPIAMAHVQSYDHLITRAILSHYLATLAFIVQQSHINARPIARFNAFASQNGRFRSCDRCATTFFICDYFGNSLRSRSKFFDSHDYLVASDRAPMVKGPLNVCEMCNEKILKDKKET